MGQKKKSIKRKGQGAGENINQNKVKVTCPKCNITFKTAGKGICPNCRNLVN
jgi:Zn finger protein HypA/HybF involved in hydrogenase expression